MDVEDQIPPTSLYKREGFPLFGKEGLGEIFVTICLFNYGLLSNLTPPFLPLAKGRLGGVTIDVDKQSYPS